VATQVLFLTVLARLTMIVVIVNTAKSGEYCNDENLTNPWNSISYEVFS